MESATDTRISSDSLPKLNQRPGLRELTRNPKASAASLDIDTLRGSDRLNVLQVFL
jgi:hypothetical protein